MIEGIYTSASGMFPRRAQLEVIANNLANVNTVGYKRDKLLFRRILDSNLALQGQSLGMEEIITDFHQGGLDPTDNNLDFAVVGDGFFTIQTPEGIRYTRSGNFSLNQEGQLVTPDGYPVMGEKGTIVLERTDIVVNEKGEVLEKGAVIDRFLITDFPQPYQLVKTGRNLFRPQDPLDAGTPASGFRLKQGFLEESNVRAIEEMVEMVVLFRNYEADQKAIRYQDESLSKAVNELGNN
jgi:flagellar basal-body rod protein FlgF